MIDYNKEIKDLQNKLKQDGVDRIKIINQIKIINNAKMLHVSQVAKMHNEERA